MSVSAAFGLTAVLLGHFTAHGLKDVLSASNSASWQTAVTYQMTHALVLLVTGFGRTKNGPSLLKVAGVLFVTGVVAFSGSIYALVLLQASWLGPVTPSVVCVWLPVGPVCSLPSVGIGPIKQTRNHKDLMSTTEFGIEWADTAFNYIRRRGRFTKAQARLRALTERYRWTSEDLDQQPLGMEIGFGMGFELLAWAQQQPVAASLFSGGYRVYAVSAKKSGHRERSLVISRNVYCSS